MDLVLLALCVRLSAAALSHAASGFVRLGAEGLGTGIKVKQCFGHTGLQANASTCCFRPARYSNWTLPAGVGLERELDLPNIRQELEVRAARNQAVASLRGLPKTQDVGTFTHGLSSWPVKYFGSSVKSGIPSPRQRTPAVAIRPEAGLKASETFSEKHTIEELDRFFGVHRSTRKLSTQSSGTSLPNDALRTLGVGSIVARGKDWQWGDQDGGSGNSGTVIEALTGGWVKVRWHRSGHENGYRAGASGKFDVRHSAGVSQLSTQVASRPPFENSEQHRKAAAHARRAATYHSTQQRPAESSPSQHVSSAALRKAQGLLKGALVSNAIAIVGMQVMRGPDWKWGVQDGGAGAVGTIVRLAADGWCHVQWPSGRVDGYRVGHGGHFDLRVAGRGSASLGQSLKVETAHRRGPKSKSRCYCIDQFGEVLAVNSAG